MVLTQITLALSIALVAAIISLLVGAVGMRKAGNVTIISVIAFLVFVPLATYMLYLNLEIYATVLDWPVELGTFLGLWSPPNAILLASMLSGFLGMIAGKYWAEDDRSCLQCLLVPFILVMILSIVILVLP